MSDAPIGITDTEVATLWWISIAVALVVVVVASGLLVNIVLALRGIDSSVSSVWTVGKRIANNTVQLWLLERVIGLVTEIRVHAYKVNDVAGSIASHAVACTHCPACVSPHGSRARVAPAISAPELQGTGGPEREWPGPHDPERASWPWRPLPRTGR